MRSMAELQKSFKASSLLSVSLVLVLLCLHITARPSMADTRIVQIGVILDLNSTLGKMLHNSLVFAVHDHYSVQTDTATKINLIVKNVPQNDVVAAASAGNTNFNLHLLKMINNIDACRA
ncbi:hypothetical protein K1719_012763 [Acacia pycnantha]|nr:hypothetical protein K1719_012763 [Acacia pycnantha]